MAGTYDQHQKVSLERMQGYLRLNSKSRRPPPITEKAIKSIEKK